MDLLCQSADMNASGGPGIHLLDHRSYCRLLLCGIIARVTAARYWRLAYMLKSTWHCKPTPWIRTKPSLSRIKISN